jgi:hypothetical protein
MNTTLASSIANSALKLFLAGRSLVGVADQQPARSSCRNEE